MEVVVASLAFAAPLNRRLFLHSFDTHRLLCPSTGWVTGVTCYKKTGPLASRPGARLMKTPPVVVFDFVKKAGEYVAERARKDIAEVSKFNDGLAKSRAKLAGDLKDLFSGIGSDLTAEALNTVFSELEDILITADMGIDVVDKVIAKLRANAKAQRVVSPADIKAMLKASLVEILEQSCLPSSKRGGAVSSAWALRQSPEPPTVIMMIGANGMGKTTTIGKLSSRFRRAGSSVLVAAGDTFRAAAVDQLAEWASRAEVDFIGPQLGVKSPSSVMFDAMEKAEARAKSDAGPYDYVILDTSGRLHTNVNLMGELQKMVRVIRKFRSDGPDEILLVVDASIGRNAVAQAKTWQREVGVTGLVVTKLDGTSRAGFVVSVVNEMQIPVKLVGVGEKLDDLRDFDAKLFVDGLVGE